MKLINIIKQKNISNEKKVTLGGCFFIYFILGFLFVPVILSNLVAYILNSSDENMLVGYFALVYLIIYLSFPKLYSKDVPRRFPNKYMFYFWEYLIFFIFGVVLGLYICGFAK